MLSIGPQHQASAHDEQDSSERLNIGVSSGSEDNKANPAGKLYPRPHLSRIGAVSKNSEEYERFEELARRFF